MGSTGLRRQAAVGRRKPQPRKGVLVLHLLQHIKDASVAVLQLRQRMHMHTGNVHAWEIASRLEQFCTAKRHSITGWNFYVPACPRCTLQWCSRTCQGSNTKSHLAQRQPAAASRLPDAIAWLLTENLSNDLSNAASQC